MVPASTKKLALQDTTVDLAASVQVSLRELVTALQAGQVNTPAVVLAQAPSVEQVTALVAVPSAAQVTVNALTKSPAWGQGEQVPELS